MTRASGRRSIMIRNRHLVALDAVLLPLAAVIAFMLRLSSAQIQYYATTIVLYALIAPVIQIPIFAALGLYSRHWRYASTDELLLVAAAAFVGSMAQGALFFVVQVVAFPNLAWAAVPRSIPLLVVLVEMVVIAAPRFAVRLWWRDSQRSAKAGAASLPQQRVLIAGAGEAGAMVLRELHANPQTGLIPIGFIDDDPGTHGMVIHRIRVLGGREAIPQLARDYHVNQVIIAMPTATGPAIREIVAVCEAAGVRARIAPGYFEMLSGQTSVGQLRDVQIDDLLRRAPVQTDTTQVGALLHGNRVLVTGGGGSIGSELCRQIASYGPATLIMLGHGENSLFVAEADMKQQAPSLALHTVVADLRDRPRLRAVLERYRPDVIFHAAAHKHVPLMESNCEDAITNNVLGTKNLVELGVASGVQNFVLISTDKAVNPTSVMGATKRVAELLVTRAARESGRCFVAVRFGNVLGSRGSVVPMFQKQIAAGGPVTVTHPDMRRYFMTIPEAAQLVLQAAALGHGGEVFALDMGEPVRIVDLANDLIRLSGFEPGYDIQIEYTGIRPGEKLFEELFRDRELYAQTQHEKILVCTKGADLAMDATAFDAAVERLAEAARSGCSEDIKGILREIVRDYCPSGMTGVEEAKMSNKATGLPAAAFGDQLTEDRG